MIRLRPHHLLCIGFFRGRGYSEEFVRHMTSVISQLNDEDPTVELVCGCDVLCGCCPHERDGVCESDTKASRYDAAVLWLCGLHAGECLPWSALRSLAVQRILQPDRLHEVCADCQWYAICQK